MPTRSYPRRVLKGDEVRARSTAAGVQLVDDEGNLGVHVADGGNVGIGTDSAGRALTVSGTDNELLRLDNTQSGGDCAINLRTSYDTDVNYAIGLKNSDDSFRISKSATIGTADRVVVDSSGNVGIGTDAPGQLLDVSGTATVDGLQIGTSTVLTSVDTDISAVSGSDDTLASAKAIKAYVDSVSGSGDITAVSITTDTGAGSKAEDLAGSADFSILGGAGIGVTNSGQTITVAASGLTVSELAAATLVTSSETIASNNNDTTIPTSAAVKSLVDASAGGISGVTITTDTGAGSKAQDTSGSADFSILGGTGADVTNSGQTITVAIDQDLSNFDNSTAGFITEEYVTTTESAMYAGAMSAGNIYFRRYPGSYNHQIYLSVANDATTIQNQYLSGYAGAAFYAARACTVTKISASGKLKAGSGMHTIRCWILAGTPQNDAAYNGTTALTLCGYVDLKNAGGTELTDNNTFASSGFTASAGATIAAGKVVVFGFEPIGGSSAATSYLAVTAEFKMT